MSAQPKPGDSRLKLAVRLALAALVLAAAGAASSLTMVGPGQAVVVTEFGRPVRVLTQPGLAWKIPAPIENTVAVDLRLRTTSSGLQDVGTREGLRILVQAYLAWQVADDPAHIEQFLRAGQRDPDDVARQLRSFMGSTLQVTASNFNLTDLVNTDPNKARFVAFEQQLQANLAQQVLDTYGIRIVQTGVERLSLPAETLAATVARMRAERETVAAQRTAEGLRTAAAIRSDASRDARLIGAQAQQEVAEIKAKGREKAASIHAAAYAVDPQLYAMLRSLDTLGATVGPKTRVILRTDAEPFRALVEGPSAAASQSVAAQSAGQSGTPLSGTSSSGAASSGTPPSSAASPEASPPAAASSWQFSGGDTKPPAGADTSQSRPSLAAPSQPAPSLVTPSASEPSQPERTYSKWQPR
jgi:membrane protease subunit HflC